MKRSRLAATVLIGLGLGLSAPAVALASPDGAVATSSHAMTTRGTAPANTIRGTTPANPPATASTASASRAVTGPTSIGGTVGTWCGGQGCHSTDGDGTALSTASAATATAPGAAAGEPAGVTADPATITGDPGGTAPTSENSERIPVDRDAFIVLAVFASVTAAVFAGFTFANPRWTDA